MWQEVFPGRLGSGYAKDLAIKLSLLQSVGFLKLILCSLSVLDVRYPVVVLVQCDPDTFYRNSLTGITTSFASFVSLSM